MKGEQSAVTAPRCGASKDLRRVSSKETNDRFEVIEDHRARSRRVAIAAVTEIDRIVTDAFGPDTCT